jgi:flagellar basal body-associated protein FliL
MRRIMVDSDGSDVARTLSAKVSARLPTALLRSDCIAAAGLAASVLLAAAAVLSALPTEKGGSRAVTVAIGSIGYHVLPEFVADLRTSRSRSHYLQLAAVLEVPEEALARLQAEETRILSDVQTRLRELQREDLAGAAGLERVRRDIGRGRRPTYRAVAGARRPLHQVPGGLTPAARRPRLGWRSERRPGTMRPAAARRGKPRVIEMPPERVAEVRT